MLFSNRAIAPMHFKEGEKKITDQNMTESYLFRQIRMIVVKSLEMIVVKSKIVVTNVQKPVHIHLENV